MRLIRLTTVRAETGLCAASVYNAVKKGLLPRQVRIGARSVAWPAHEIATVNAARAAGKTDAEIKRLVSELHTRRVAALGVAAE